MKPKDRILANKNDSPELFASALAVVNQMIRDGRTAHEQEDKAEHFKLVFNTDDIGKAAPRTPVQWDNLAKLLNLMLLRTGVVDEHDLTIAFSGDAGDAVKYVGFSHATINNKNVLVLDKPKDKTFSDLVNRASYAELKEMSALALSAYQNCGDSIKKKPMLTFMIVAGNENSFPTLLAPVAKIHMAISGFHDLPMPERHKKETPEGGVQLLVEETYIALVRQLEASTKCLVR